MIRRILGGLLLAATPGIAAAGEVAPADHAARDLYLRFERAGYVGAVYLNADDTYVIVQTGPQDRTESFSGRWSANGPTGVCIHPDGGSPGKCLPALPSSVGGWFSVTSDQRETYRLSLRRRR